MQKMMEYMALGKPIVAFDLPEHRFSAQQAALYVRPNDELEFARALAELMDDPERRQAMGCVWTAARGVGAVLAAFGSVAAGGVQGALRGRRCARAGASSGTDRNSAIGMKSPTHGSRS